MIETLWIVILIMLSVGLVSAFIRLARGPF